MNAGLNDKHALEYLWFHNRPTTEPASNNRDEALERKHAGDTTAARPKTPEFPALSQFLVATGTFILPSNFHSPCKPDRFPRQSKGAKKGARLSPGPELRVVLSRLVSLCFVIG